MKSDAALLRSAKHKNRLIIISALLMLAAGIISIAVGNMSIPVIDVIRILGRHFGWAQDAERRFITIVWDVRLPRIFMAMLSGMALSMSGSVFQCVFRNPLVEPYILGVSSAASCGAAIAIVYFAGTMPVGVFAFAFSVIAMLMAYTIATRNGSTPLINLILSGMIVSSLFTALLNLVKTIAPDSALREITFWLMGGFYTAKWNDVAVLFPSVLIGGGILRILAWKLNVLTAGDQEAKTLGVNVGLLKFTSLGISTFLTAIVVSRTGIISWVGLMIPHITRMLLGPDNRYSIPFSAFLGGFFLVFCDSVARTVIMGEIPISIITSVLGAPYLIYLLRTSKRMSM